MFEELYLKMWFKINKIQSNCVYDIIINIDEYLLKYFKKVILFI